MVAVAVTGFLGYDVSVGGGALDAEFVQPWQLVLWLCTLLVTVAIFPLRGSASRRQLILMVATCVFAGLFFIVIQYSSVLPDVLRNLLQYGRLSRVVVQQSVTYTIANFALILIYVIASLRRWVGLGPSVQLLGIDLVIGGVLTALLGVMFTPAVLGLFIHPPFGLTPCTLSWPLGSCSDAGPARNPPMLWQLDLVQAAASTSLGLLVLSTSTFAGGVHQFGYRLRVALEGIVYSLRRIEWPALTFIAAASIVTVATAIQHYLHSSRTLDDIVTYELPAILWSVVAILSIVGASALLGSEWRVVLDTLGFVVRSGIAIFLRLWIYLLVLWGFNYLALLTFAAARHPFDPLGWEAGASLGALLLYLVVRRTRRKAAPSPQPGLNY
jgi:hypothetical protein